MRDPADLKSIQLPLTPLQVMDAWPVDEPLLMLHGSGGHARWAEWSILARPTHWRRVHRPDGQMPSNLCDVASFFTATDNLSPTCTSAIQIDDAAADVPFRGGWIGFMSYELGSVLEPRAAVNGRSAPRGQSPLMTFARCDHALVHHHGSERWYSVGETDWRRFLDPVIAINRDVPKVGELVPRVPEHAYLSAIDHVLDYIAAGDVFQVNLTHQLVASMRGSTRALARTALHRSRAWYGAYLELLNGQSLISMSPELFLKIDGASRIITTRPIKGTRPAACDPIDLLVSEKDAAELHMIIDLMRNDLGRVCEYGSVCVPDARAIETHGTVHQGVGQVAGRLRNDVSLHDVMRATFPPGSVTGAPKIRAMQIIEALEPFERGPYCGAIGFISDHGDACFNVAIRTIMLEGTRPAGRFDVLDGTLRYGIGGGIVADSDPALEYQETLDKAAVLNLAVQRRMRELTGVC